MTENKAPGGRRSNRLLDSLTGVYSRDSLDGRLEEEAARSKRYNRPFTLAMIDLDHFKSINDGFGHSRGDAILVEFAQRLRATMRRDDLIFRLGGDEFVLLLPNTDKFNGSILAQRLLDMMRTTPFEGTPPVSLTLSLGMACYPLDGRSPAELKTVADRRAYQAKRQGRDRVIAQDVELPGEPLFDDLTRLIERDEAQEKLYRFFDGLPRQVRAVLRVSGSPGCGQSRFLLEAESLARLRGYSVLRIEGHPARQKRIYGALVDAVGMEDLPHPVAVDGSYASTLNQRLSTLEKSGLVIVVHDLQYLDRATLALLHDLYFSSPALEQLAVVYADDAAGANLYFLSEAGRQPQITLKPFTLAGVRLWVRHHLQWEAPEKFVEWLLWETGGRPAELRRLVQALVARGLLNQGAQGWEMTTSFSPAMSLADIAPQVRGNLPDLPGDFIGRVEELRRVKHLLQEHRLVTILGAGGLGKTRLGLQAASELVQDFRHGAYFLATASLDSVDYLLTGLAGILQFSLLNVKDLRQELLDFLKDKEILLVLDSIEHLLEAVPFILDVVKAAPQMRVLVTSRQRLLTAVGGELELLPMPQPELDEEELASKFEAVQLFLHSAGLADYQKGWDAPDWKSVIRICQLVQGIPLGLELAAAWTETLACKEIAAALEQSLDFLINQQKVDASRQPTLVPVFDAFWRLLSAHEQIVLMRLLVFRGGFSQRAAQVVAGASPFFLYALAAQSYLRRLTRRDQGSAEESRYEMHLLLQQFGLERLRAWPVEKDQAEAAHCIYYANYLKECYPRLRNDGKLQRDLRRELDNIRAAWNYAVQNTRLEQIETAAPGLTRFYNINAMFTEGLQALAKAAENIKNGNFHQEQKGQVKRALLTVLVQQMRLELTLSNFDGAVCLEQEIKQLMLAENLDPRGNQPLGNQPPGDQPPAFQDVQNVPELFQAGVLSQCEQTQGLSCSNQGEQDQAILHLKRGLEWAEMAGDRAMEADCLRLIGNVYLELAGRLQDATKAYKRSLAISQELDDQYATVSTINNLGLVALSENDLEQARIYFNKLLDVAIADGDPMSKVTAQINVGLLDTMSYHFDQAEAQITPAFVKAESVGAHSEAMTAAWGLAFMELSRGDLEAAARRYAYVLQKTEELKDALARARVLADLGLLYLRQGNAEKARQVSQESAEQCQKFELNDGPGYAFTHLGYAWLGLAGDGEAEKLEKAAGAFEQAVQAWKDELRPNLLIEPLAGLALIRQRRGEHETARKHVEAILEFLKTGELAGHMEPVNVYLACWEVLQAAGDPGALHVLKLGNEFLQMRAERQANPAVRKSLLENIPAHVRLLELAQDHLIDKRS